jgi:putative transcriptional regulator|tara:strand:- start:4245 stop:4805 length:561 start_codon:yes stop_codon:yes gene_type:complete
MDQDLLGKILIASPGLEDLRFQNTVILICEHTSEVIMGLILNKPIHNFNTKDLLKQLKIESNAISKVQSTFYGGPVHLNQGFIIHSDEIKYSNSESILNNVIITTSNEVLIDISKGTPPLDTKVFLGCAVWDNNQLDNEMLENSWIISNGTKDLIFHQNSELSLWNKCLLDIGIDPNRLVSYSGNA